MQEPNNFFEEAAFYKALLIRSSFEVYAPFIPCFAVHFVYLSRSFGSADGFDCSSTSKKSSRNTGRSPSLSFGTSRQFISTAPLHFDSHGRYFCSASCNGVSLCLNW